MTRYNIRGLPSAPCGICTAPGGAFAVALPCVLGRRAGISPVGGPEERFLRTSLPSGGPDNIQLSLPIRGRQEGGCRVSIHGTGPGRAAVPASSACRTRLYLPLAPPCAYWTPPSLGDAVIEDYSAIDDRKTASPPRHMLLGATSASAPVKHAR